MSDARRRPTTSTSSIKPDPGIGGRARLRGRAASADARRVRRPAEGARAAATAAAGGGDAVAHARPHPARRPARPRQDDARDDRRPRERPPAADVERPGHPARRRSGRAAVVASCPARCSSSTRSTGWRAAPRRCSTSRWRTSASTSWSARARARRASRSTWRRSPSSARRRVRACCRTRCATASDSPRTSSSTPTTSSTRCSRARPARSGSTCPAEARAEIASRSRGTPRIAHRLLRRVRDYALVHGQEAGLDAVNAALELYDVDPLGLDRLDRAILDAVVRRFDGGPVGLEHPRGVGRRGAGDDRIGRRAVPGAGRDAEPHAARSGGHPAGLGAPRAVRRRADRASRAGRRSSTMTYDSGEPSSSASVGCARFPHPGRLPPHMLMGRHRSDYRPASCCSPS